MIFYTFESAEQLHARKRQNGFKYDQDIVAFKLKIQLWIHRIENGRLSAFSALNPFAEEVEIDFRWIRQIFLERLNASHRHGSVYPFSQLHRVARSLEIFSRTFCFSRDTVDCFHGCPQRGQNGFLPTHPMEIGTKNQKLLENLMSVSRFRSILFLQ